ncbi:MAG TPA: right-handed parallel beta-helix repeat-containing protein [Lysobacter sp.]
MQIVRSLIVVGLLAIGHPAAVHAAEDYANCTGFIDTLPATIATQGTWCLKKHLYTSQTSGAAITIANDNITIDCNDFRLSGLGAGKSTNAIGILSAADRHDATIRHCRIQGFKFGLQLAGSNHLVEKNHLDGNRYIGIYTDGEANVVRDNFIVSTGGLPGMAYAYAIYATGGSNSATQPQILDNQIGGVSPAGNAAEQRYPRGILGSGLVAGNVVSLFGFAANQPRNEPTFAYGIYLVDRGIVNNNALLEWDFVRGIGIRGNGEATSICRDNDVQQYTQYPESKGISDCQLAGQNLVQIFP